MLTIEPIPQYKIKKGRLFKHRPFDHHYEEKGERWNPLSILSFALPLVLPNPWQTYKTMQCRCGKTYAVRV